MFSEEELGLLNAIRETGSLSRAAARLGKAPSTVSHAARQFETRFDALLFDRSLPLNSFRHDRLHWVVNENSISPTAAIHDRQIQPATE
jgi:hypothetical protein